jgi:hypothetical protein
LTINFWATGGGDGHAEPGGDRDPRDDGADVACTEHGDPRQPQGRRHQGLVSTNATLST